MSHKRARGVTNDRSRLWNVAGDDRTEADKCALTYGTFCFTLEPAPM